MAERSEEFPETTIAHPNDRGHDGRGRFVASYDTARRDVQAAELRSTGMTWQAIADRLGYSGPGAAHNAYRRALQLLPTPEAADARKEEIAHLESLRERLLGMLDERYYTVSNGRVVYHPDREEPLHDRAPVLAAIDRLIKIDERLAKLQGLDTPTTSVIGAQVNYVIEGVDVGRV